VNEEDHSTKSKIDYYTLVAEDTIFPEPCEGEIWSVRGCATWEESPSFDGNYTIKKHHVNIEETVRILSKNPIGFKSFIADTPHFKGVGIATANKLWDKFGDETYKILEDKDLARLMTIKGLGEESAVSLITGYDKFSYLKH
jgi:exodeoxyribonuclease V alpha subunit